MIALDAIRNMDGRTLRERLPASSEAAVIGAAERALQWQAQVGCSERVAKDALDFLRGRRPDTKGLPTPLRAYLATLESDECHAVYLAARRDGLATSARRWLKVGRALLHATNR